MSDLTFERTIHAPIHQVYTAFTNSTALREWMCDGATTNEHPNGRFYVWWNEGYYAAGEFTLVDPDKCLAFTWLGRGEPAATRVNVDLRAQNGSTLVKLVHSGLGDGETWEALRKVFQVSWQSALENLASVLETGRDLRLVNRPMLGISLSDFDADIAIRHGIPVSEGVRLDSVLSGMGAEAAGLQTGDVIVEIDGNPIPNVTSLTAAIQSHRAGDQIEVGFYRGGEKKKAMMQLSPRPVPDPLADGAALAEHIRTENQASLSALEETFAGVTEAEAGFRPAEGEWSAKEILAHLILGERDTTQSIADIVGQRESWYDDFSGNSHPRTSAVVAVYSTVRDLLDELRRSMTETAAMIALLPASITAQKSIWWRVNFNFLQGPFHTMQHIEQMKAAIAAARMEGQ
jgi:uncharacterized protein YndB with AHSA1/START domain